MLLGENSRKTKRRKILRESSRLAHAHSHARGYCAWRSVCRGGSVHTPTSARYKALLLISGSLRLGLCLCCHKASPTRFIRGIVWGQVVPIEYIYVFFFCQTFLFAVRIHLDKILTYFGSSYEWEQKSLRKVWQNSTPTRVCALNLICGEVTNWLSIHFKNQPLAVSKSPKESTILRISGWRILRTLFSKISYRVILLIHFW